VASSVGLRALVRRHLSGLTESRSWYVRLAAAAVMYLPPTAVISIVAVYRLDLTDAASALIGGFSLIAGVLIAVFTQLAAWRDRLADRAEERWLTDAPARRAVDRAVAHVLVGVVGSVAAVVFAVMLEADVTGTTVWSAALGGAATWLLVLLLTIVRAVAIGYESTADEDVRRQDRDLLNPVEPFPVPSTDQPSQR
jgi:hypothetical protein